MKRGGRRFPIRVGFRDANGDRTSAFCMGDRTELLISLPDGYRFGDLAQVSLPGCLFWISGGGKVKRFTVDFEGRDEIRVPLLVTSRSETEQHFAVSVRNMFEEERVTSPGLLGVMTSA